MCASPERLLSDAAAAATSYGTDGVLLELEHAKGESATSSSMHHVSVGVAWALLILAILLEVAGTTSMKLSEGFTRLLPSILIYVLYAASFTVFPFALQAIELSTAYAVWSGLGTTVTAIIGFVWFKDTVNLTKVLALTAIVCGCVVLNFADDINEKMEEEVGQNEEGVSLKGIEAVGGT